jgi:polar amino acid transport system substrate-binding protein
MQRARAAAMAMAVAMTLVSCNLPRDPERTLERARGGTIRVGAVENPPWVVVREGRVEGVEPALAESIAADAGAQIEWVVSSETVLFEELKHNRIDLLVGGLRDDSPWTDQIALTDPYFTREGEPGRVLALPPGENAWLLRVERMLAGKQAEARRLVEPAQRESS